MPQVHVGGVGGIVQLNEIAHDYTKTENEAAVTVTSGGAVIPVITKNIIVKTGDLLIVSASARVSKGATGGATLFFIRQNGGSGDADINLQESFAYEIFDHPASTSLALQVSGITEVLGDGDVDIHLSATSFGSDNTISANRAELRIFHLQT